ncbi:MAG: glycosyltransferase family 2 protein, partial [Thermodesulfobacteriota bacterium]
GEGYLEEAVESILNQTFRAFEFIIIDDASTDNSRDLLEGYATRDQRIVLLRNEHNLGLTKSLNRGLRFARGQFIARQDADDVSLPKRLQMQVAFLDEHQHIGMVGSHVAFINDDGEEFTKWKMPTSHEKLIKTLGQGNSFCHGSVMVRRSCLQRVGSYRDKFKYAQDYDLWLRVSEHFHVANVDVCLYKHRRSRNGISRNKLGEQLNYHLLAAQLAGERRRTGCDSLANIECDDVVSVLKSKYSLMESEIRAFKGNVFMRRFNECLRAKDYGGALRVWVKGFLLDRKVGKIRVLSEGIYRTMHESVVGLRK